MFVRMSMCLAVEHLEWHCESTSAIWHLATAHPYSGATQMECGSGEFQVRSTAVNKQLWTPVILKAGRSLVSKLKSMKTQLLAEIICQLLDFSDA